MAGAESSSISVTFLNTLATALLTQQEQQQSQNTVNQTTLAVSPPFGDYSTAIATTAFVLDSLGQGSLTGSIIMWVGNSGNRGPVGYLYCDGSEYLIEQYNALYNVIKNMYGGNSGNGTFCVPNMTGMFPIGASHREPRPVSNILGGRDITGGSNTISIDQIPSHAHNYDAAFSSTGTIGGSATLKTHGLSTTYQTGSNNPYAPPFFAVNFIIKS
jgi:microcystin-dependent protein